MIENTKKALEQIVFDGIEQNATKKAHKQAELDGKSLPWILINSVIDHRYCIMIAYFEKKKQFSLREKKLRNDKQLSNNHREIEFDSDLMPLGIEIAVKKCSLMHFSLWYLKFRYNGFLTTFQIVTEFKKNALFIKKL